jgi:hypothetical protein
MVCELCSLNTVDSISGMGGSLASSSRNKRLPELMNVPAFFQGVTGS